MYRYTYHIDQTVRYPTLTLTLPHMPCRHSETVIMPYWHSQSPFHIVPLCTWSSVCPVGICPWIPVCPVGIPVHPIFFNGHNPQPFISNEHLPCSHTTTNPHRPPPPQCISYYYYYIVHSLHRTPICHVGLPSKCLCHVDTHKLFLFNEHLPYLHIALWTFPIGVYALWALPIPPSILCPICLWSSVCGVGTTPWTLIRPVGILIVTCGNFQLSFSEKIFLVYVLWAFPAGA